MASVVGAPSPPRLTFVKNVDVPPSRDATFFFSLWLQGADGEKTTVEPVLDGPVTIPAGATSSSSVEVTVPPSPFGYIWEEIPAPGYVDAGPRHARRRWMCATPLAGVVANTRAVGTIEVTKVVEGSTVGASATATVVVDCSPGTDLRRDVDGDPGGAGGDRPDPDRDELHGVGAGAAARATSWSTSARLRWSSPPGRTRSR